MRCLVPKLFLCDTPCSDEFLSGLAQKFPEVDSYSFYTYLTMRKVSNNLENSLESYFSSYGVSAGRFMLLLLLSSNEQGMMPSELAHECGVTQATISGLLSGLEKTKLIVRETHSQDGRAYVIKLSKAGLDLIGILKPEFLNFINSLMNPFSADEKKQMVAFLLRFSVGLKQLNELKTARSLTSNVTVL